MLEAVTDVVSTEAAALDSLQTAHATSSAGAGQGDSRPPGPLGEGQTGEVHPATVGKGRAVAQDQLHLGSAALRHLEAAIGNVLPPAEDVLMFLLLDGLRLRTRERNG